MRGAQLFARLKRSLFDVGRPQPAILIIDPAPLPANAENVSLESQAGGFVNDGPI